MKGDLFHKEMIDMVEDYTRRYTIVRGFCDMVLDSDGMNLVSCI